MLSLGCQTMYAERHVLLGPVQERPVLVDRARSHSTCFHQVVLKLGTHALQYKAELAKKRKRRSLLLHCSCAKAALELCVCPPLQSIFASIGGASGHRLECTRSVRHWTDRRLRKCCKCLTSRPILLKDCAGSLKLDWSPQGITNCTPQKTAFESVLKSGKRA
jgi:hypothetical protein